MWQTKELEASAFEEFLRCLLRARRGPSFLSGFRIVIPAGLQVEPAPDPQFFKELNETDPVRSTRNAKTHNRTDLRPTMA